MTFVVGDAQFGSSFAIDKIQSWSTSTDASDGNTPHRNATIPAGQTVGSGPTAYTASTPNVYGKRGLPYLVWSFDQTNWYPARATVFYFNSTFRNYLMQMSVVAEVNDNTIFFQFITEYTASQQVYLQFAITNPT